MNAKKVLRGLWVFVSAVALSTTAVHADLVTNSPDLPPSGVYVTTAELPPTTYIIPGVGEVRLDGVELSPNVASATRHAVGADEIEEFGSSLQGSGSFTPEGSSPVPITFDLNGTVVTRASGKIGNTTGTFDTEMLAMSLTGMTPLGSLRIRESPSEPSPGRTSIDDIGGGQYRIDSFFDVFTEISIDGGQSWIPSGGATHLFLVPEPATFALMGVAGLIGSVVLLRKRKG